MSVGYKGYTHWKRFSRCRSLFVFRHCNSSSACEANVITTTDDELWVAYLIAFLMRYTQLRNRCPLDSMWWRVNDFNRVFLYPRVSEFQKIEMNLNNLSITPLLQVSNWERKIKQWHIISKSLKYERKIWVSQWIMITPNTWGKSRRSITYYIEGGTMVKKIFLENITNRIFINTSIIISISLEYVKSYIFLEVNNHKRSFELCRHI